MTRPTVHDLAKVAGVSLATIDRVLNGRPGVSEKTIAKVTNAIEEIGYSRNLAATKLAKRNRQKFLFLLPDAKNEVIGMIGDAIDQLSKLTSADQIDVIIQRAPIHQPLEFVKKLDALDLKAIDGIAIMGPETPELVAAINQIHEKRIPIIALISDLPNAPSVNFVGIDNIAAGRTAGVLLGRFLSGKSGKILVISGASDVRDHADRRLGFDEVLNSQFPHLDALPSIEGWDDADRVEEMVLNALDTHKDIIGIYSLAAGNKGLINCLQTQPELSKNVVIAHELTSHSKAALKEGVFDALIVQDIGHIVRSAIRKLKATSDHSEVIQAQEHIRIEIILKENL